jgi:hypothetical protein
MNEPSVDELILGTWIVVLRDLGWRLRRALDRRAVRDWETFEVHMHRSNTLAAERALIHALEMLAPSRTEAAACLLDLPVGKELQIEKWEKAGKFFLIAPTTAVIAATRDNSVDLLANAIRIEGKRNRNFLHEARFKLRVLSTNRSAESTHGAKVLLRKLSA